MANHFVQKEIWSVGSCLMWRKAVIGGTLFTIFLIHSNRYPLQACYTSKIYYIVRSLMLLIYKNRISDQMLSIKKEIGAVRRKKFKWIASLGKSNLIHRLQVYLTVFSFFFSLARPFPFCWQQNDVNLEFINLSIAKRWNGFESTEYSHK